MRAALMAIVLAACSNDYRLPPEQQCLSLSSGLTDTEAEATLAALDAWGGATPALTVEIGGRCPNKLRRAERPAKGRNAHTDVTFSMGARVGSEIVLHAPMDEPCFAEQIITHELGHFWGLNEDPDKRSLMYPNQKGCKPERKLSARNLDEAAAIQGLQ